MDDKGYIEIFFTPDVIISMISRLEVEFTKYLLNQVSDFKSKYSIRLYEIIIKWAAKGQTERYKLDDLRDMLGI
jgi:plasmid replication initiation protein